MRRVDEILSAYENQTLAGRTYLLRGLERQPITIDSVAPLALLRKAERGEEADLARLAEEHFTARVERDQVLRASGNATAEAGEWSQFFQPGKDLDPGARDRALEAAAAPALAPLVPALARCVERAGPNAPLALKTLARIRIPASLEVLEVASDSSVLLPVAVGALSIFGGAQAAEVALRIARAWEGTPLLAGLLYSFRNLSTPEVHAYLADRIDDPDLQVPIAVALEGSKPQQALPLLDHIVDPENPWTTLHVVETLGRLGSQEAIEQLGDVFFRVDHPLVKVACLQSAAAAKSKQGAEIAGMALRHKHPLVRAAAIETLVAVRAPRDSYKDLVLTLIDSKHPRLAMNAALACLMLEPRKAVQRINDLLRSGKATDMLQGTHCLAYMETPGSAPLLRALIDRSPPGTLRLEAVRALGRRARDNVGAGQTLNELLGHEDLQVRRTAAWFIASSVTASRGKGCEALARAIHAEADPRTAATMIRALALAGPHASDHVAAIRSRLGEAPPVGRAAAWALATGFPEAVEAQEMDELPSLGIRSWSCLRRWYTCGEGLDTLAKLIDDGDPTEEAEALRVARLAAGAATYVGQPENLQGLAAALEPHRGVDSTSVEVALPPEMSLSGSTTRMSQVEAQPFGRPVELIASGRDELEAPAPEEPEFHAQVIPADQAGAALPSEADFRAALEDEVSTEEADQAIVEASFFSLRKENYVKLLEEEAERERQQTAAAVSRRTQGLEAPEVEDLPELPQPDLGAAPDPAELDQAARDARAWAVLQLLVFFVGALVAGQYLRTVL